MPQRGKITYVLLDGASADTAHAGVNVTDFRNIVIEVKAGNSPNLVLMAQGATGQGTERRGRPDFTANRSPSNPWEYIQMIDLQDGAKVSGDTGVTLNSSDPQAQVRLFEINTNQLDWFSVQVTTYSAGAVTATAHMTTND